MFHNASADPLQGWVLNKDRGTQNIISSCFSIIILCLWSMLHLNLPAPDDTTWTIILDKARWMLLGLLFPELIMCFAYAQMTSAMQSLEDMTSLDICHGQWSVVHGFYADMGGFVLKLQDFEAFPVTAKQLYVLVKNGIMPIPSIGGREITDKSKGNWFVKGLAMWQTSYILVTICIRLAQGLAVTPLEIMTATIGFCAFLTILLWWRKPLDVETPTVLTMALTVDELIQIVGPDAARPWSETPLDFAERDIYMTRKWSRRVTEYLIRIGMQSRPLKRVPNDRDFKPTCALHHQALALPVILSAALSIYSGWAFTFPTAAEQKAWIILSIASIAALFIYGISEVIGFKRSGYQAYSMEILGGYKKRHGWCWLFHVLGSVALGTRVGLFALSLSSLRSMPKSCFMELGFANLFSVLG